MERTRSGIQQRQQEVSNGDTVERGRVGSERRFTTEQARPNVSQPAPRVRERESRPSPYTERREESPRRAEMSAPQRMERSEQRMDRQSPRIGPDRQANQDRVR